MIESFFAKRERRMVKEGEDAASTPYDTDLNRIIQSQAFRRLAGVTQVVSAREGHVYHNRLTHSLKVARVARLIAENLSKTDPITLKKMGGLSPKVVEAAALAHDLGHPPFGHCGEKTLDRMVRSVVPQAQRQNLDGFEGNAQSFRIVTKLAHRHTSIRGLNLTYATLNAILKYPWLRHPTGGKYGVFRTEKVYLNEIRGEVSARKRTLEAEIMDYADDVAYALHDLEDFYKAGIIPLDRLVASSIFSKGMLKEDREKYFSELEGFVKYLDQENPMFAGERVRRVLNRLLNLFPVFKPFEGSLHEQNLLREMFAVLTEDFTKKIVIENGELKTKIKTEVEILKRLTFYFVIDSRAMQIQQNGQIKIIEHLFNEYYEASELNNLKHATILPRDFADILEIERRYHGDEISLEELRARVVTDVISQMSDDGALQTYLRLTGHNPGSFFDSAI